MYNKIKAQESTIKFTLNLIIAACTLVIFTTCIFMAGALILGDVGDNLLRDIGLFFVITVTLCLSSATAFFLYTYMLELRVAISTYRFYRTLTGSGSLILLTESYYTVIKGSYTTPIRAKHIDGNGKIVTGQWNGVGDWTVENRKTTRKYSGNKRWP